MVSTRGSHLASPGRVVVGEVKGAGFLSTPDMRPWLSVLVAMALTVVLSAFGVWKPLERWAFDLSMGLLAAGDSTEDGYVRVIGIDDASLQSVGPWPWPRAVLAELLERTAEAGADVVVLDILLAEAALDDGRLQSAMDGPASVILPYHGSGQFYVYPNEVFAQHSTFAHGDVVVDPDGVVRRIPALSGQGEFLHQEGVSPWAISVEAVRQFVGRQHHAGTGPLTLAIGIQDSSLRMGVVEYPLDRQGNLVFAFPPCGESSSIWPPSQVYSAVDVLDGKIDRGELANKIVFIGATAIGLPDRHMSSRIRRGPIAGVFFHATAAWALLAGKVVDTISPVIVGVMGVVLTLFQVAYIYRQELVQGLLYTVLSLIAITGLYLFLMFNRFLLFPLAHLACTTVIFYVFGLAYRYSKAVIARKRLADSLRRYFSPPVLEQILAEEGGLVTREVVGTVVFADFRGFTGLAERLSPLTTVSVLNQHLAGLVEIVFDYGGTLDKFTGDGVMAFFGAPLPDTAHRELAAAAAWDMQEFCERLSKEGRTGFELLNLRLAVGMASGRFVVGNIGAGERFDYTAIGDVVNTAARLEQQAGPGEILLDANTAENLSGQWLVEDLGSRLLRGKQSPQRVYRLVRRGEVTHGQADSQGRKSST